MLITGFMAENTLGRKIVDKLPEVPIFGEPMRLRAEVVKLNELSGHADQRELLDWIKPMARRPEEGLPGARRAGAVGRPGQGHRRARHRDRLPERGETVELV